MIKAVGSSYPGAGIVTSNAIDFSNYDFAKIIPLPENTYSMGASTFASTGETAKFVI